MASLSSRYGGWAVVTGASSGIGESFAEQLAHEGMNLVLVARSEDRLEKTAIQLRTQYAVQVRVLPLDLTEPTSAETLDLETLDLDVGLLISNAAVEQRGAFLLHPFWGSRSLFGRLLPRRPLDRTPLLLRSPT